MFWRRELSMFKVGAIFGIQMFPGIKDIKVFLRHSNCCICPISMKFSQKMDNDNTILTKPKFVDFGLKMGYKCVQCPEKYVTLTSPSSSKQKLGISSTKCNRKFLFVGSLYCRFRDMYLNFHVHVVMK